MKFEEKNARFYNLNKNTKDCRIYFLIKDGEVVYVGKTVHGTIRPLQHSDKDFDSFYMIKCSEKYLAKKEVEMILKYQPKYNGNIDCLDNNISITNLYRLLISNGIGLRGLFIRYAIYKAGIKSTSFRHSYFISKKDVPILIDYIKNNYKELSSMQNESLSIKFSGEPTSLYPIGVIVSFGNNALKDCVYFGLITKVEMKEAINFLKQSKTTISKEEFYRQFPNFLRIERLYNDVSIFEEFCKENKIRITR